MQIDISLSELFLWVWCVVATVLAVYYRYHAHMRHLMILHLLHNDEARNHMVDAIKKLEESSND